MKKKENNLSEGSASLLLDTMQENELDIFPQLIENADESGKTILVKHNYYSSDSDHGHALLAAFLDVLSDEVSGIARIILIDSGTHLLCSEDPCYEKFLRLMNGNIKIYVCRESYEIYSVSETDISQDNIELITAQSIVLELLDSNNILTIE